MAASGVTSGSKIIDLRNLLAARFPSLPSPPETALRTSIDRLDDLLGTGLPRGAITEITAPHPGSGSALLIHTLLDAACRERTFLALVDGHDSFDPQPLGDDRLRHLLWVRCRSGMEALKASDLLLRDGNFPLIILDLVLNRADELRKIPQTHWYRLQRLVEPTSSAFVVLTRHGMISSAQVKLVLENGTTLADLARDYSPARWEFRLQRRQGGRLQMKEAG